MKKLALSLLAFLCSAGAVQAQQGGPQIPCNKFFQVSQAATALTKVISGAVGQSISICGWALNAGAATATASVSYGTGSNCGTGTTTIWPVISLGINGVYVDHVSIAQIAPPSVNASGVANDVCLVTTGTGPMAVTIYYSQTP